MTSHPVDLEALQKLLDEWKAMGAHCPRSMTTDTRPGPAGIPVYDRLGIAAVNALPALIAEVRAARQALGEIDAARACIEYDPPSDPARVVARLRLIVENHNKQCVDFVTQRNSAWRRAIDLGKAKKAAEGALVRLLETQTISFSDEQAAAIDYACDEVLKRRIVPKEPALASSSVPPEKVQEAGAAPPAPPFCGVCGRRVWTELDAITQVRNPHFCCHRNDAKPTSINTMECYRLGYERLAAGPFAPPVLEEKSQETAALKEGVADAKIGGDGGVRGLRTAGRGEQERAPAPTLAAQQSRGPGNADQPGDMRGDVPDGRSSVAAAQQPGAAPACPECGPLVTPEELRKLLDNAVPGVEELGRSLKKVFRLPDEDLILDAGAATSDPCGAPPSAPALPKEGSEAAPAPGDADRAVRLLIELDRLSGTDAKQYLVMVHDARVRSEERDLAKPLIDAVEAYKKASKQREHLGSYGIRIQEAAEAFVERICARTSDAGGGQ